MSSIWVKCLDCGQQFDIEDGIKGDFRCPVCRSRFFEYDDDRFEKYFTRESDDYESIIFY